MWQFISHPELIICAFMLSGLGFRRFQLCSRARAYCVYLTIILRARMGSESIAHEAED